MKRPGLRNRARPVRARRAPRRTRCAASSTSAVRPTTSSGCTSCCSPFSRLDVPRVYRELSTERLLVMEAIDGGPLREAPEGRGARSRPQGSCSSPTAPRSWSTASSTPILTRATCFGAMARSTCWTSAWSASSIASCERRSIMLLLAFWRGDAEFLGDVLMMLSDEQRDDAPVDREPYCRSGGSDRALRR